MNNNPARPIRTFMLSVRFTASLIRASGFSTIMLSSLSSCETARYCSPCRNNTELSGLTVLNKPASFPVSVIGAPSALKRQRISPCMAWLSDRETGTCEPTRKRTTARGVFWGALMMVLVIRRKPLLSGQIERYVGAERNRSASSSVSGS